MTHPWVEAESKLGKLLLVNATRQTMYTGVAVFLLSLPNGLLKAYVLANAVWLWFMVPLGLPRVTTLQAFGALLTLNFIQGRTSTKETKPQDQWTVAEHVEAQKKLWYGLLSSYLFVGMGYLFAWALAKYMGLT